METLAGVLIGLVLGTAGGLGVWWWRGKRSGPDIRVATSIEELRSVGQLSVFKVFTKEIVTASDHWAGDFGKRFLNWLTSTKKIAMIFEFDIDFRYDLRAEGFSIEPMDDLDMGGYRLHLPPCVPEIYIRDISFYDEQKSRLLPILLPDVLSSIFCGSYTEEEKNKLKDAARQQAEMLARRLIDRLRSEVQGSARETIEMLAQGFGAECVELVFHEEGSSEVTVSEAAVAAAAEPQQNVLPEKADPS